MTAPPAPAPRSGLSFRLAGVPVRIEWSLLLILGLLGLNAGDLLAIGLWVAIGVVSIVLHELGHALTARAAGADPHIELAGFGGVTRYEARGRAASRGWRLLISLAGPATGVAVGLATLAVDAALGRPGGYLGVSLSILLFTSFGWSIFNLLPILPLDGGQALAQLLPGDEPTRIVRTAWVGLVTSILLVLGAALIDQLFLALFGGLFAFQNYRTATAARTAAREHETLATLLAERDWSGLRDALASGRGDHALATAAQVGAAEHGQHQVAAEIGEVVLRRGTDDPSFVHRTAASWRALGLEDRAVRVEVMLRRPPSDGPEPPPPPSA